MVFVNITNTNAVARGFGTLRSSDDDASADRAAVDRISSVNFDADTPPNPNLAPAVVGPDGRICYDAAVAAHDVILDRLGALSSDASVELSPRRLVDTRIGEPLADGESVCVTVGGTPPAALRPGDLAVVNITPIRAHGRRLWLVASLGRHADSRARRQDRFSSVNFAPDTSPNPNLAVSTVGADGAICYDASVSSHHVALDLVAGIVAEQSPRLTAQRILDTRSRRGARTRRLTLCRTRSDRCRTRRTVACTGRLGDRQRDSRARGRPWLRGTAVVRLASDHRCGGCRAVLVRQLRDGDAARSEPRRGDDRC